jgi:ribosomal-protein-alanine N-acetyltransferase
MPENLRFKLLSIQDVDSLESLHGKSFDVPWTKDAFASLMTLPTTLVIGAFDEDQSVLVGFLMVSLLTGMEAEILTFCVHPLFRKKGVGTFLLGELLSTLSLFDCSICSLDVDENNETAIQLYKKFGFEITGKRHNYYKSSKGNVSSSLLMVLNRKNNVKNNH